MAMAGLIKSKSTLKNKKLVINEEKNQIKMKQKLHTQLIEIDHIVLDIPL